MNVNRIYDQHYGMLGKDVACDADFRIRAGLGVLASLLPEQLPDNVPVKAAKEDHQGLVAPVT